MGLMINDKGKKPSESAVETRYLVMPQQANPQGTAFGGAIVGWIDMVAAMAAQRHCGTEVVTAGIDSLVFRHPVRIGDHVVLKAAVNYVSRSSMEVGVQVIRDDPYSGEQIVATTAHLTLVALDGQKRPPPLRRCCRRRRRRKPATKAHGCACRHARNGSRPLSRRTSYDGSFSYPRTIGKPALAAATRPTLSGTN